MPRDDLVGDSERDPCAVEEGAHHVIPTVKRYRHEFRAGRLDECFGYRLNSFGAIPIVHFFLRVPSAMSGQSH
jgi:hypothetical protein